jgi:RHS repeat-associated protein
MVDWYLADNQGSVRDVAQYSGGVTTIVDHVIFDSFGQATQGPGFTSDPLPEFTYNGTWQDPATGLNKMGKRWDDAVDDVFASQDPAGLKGGPNGFGGGQTNTEEYCGNSPTNYTDPTGEWSLFRWIYTGDGNASDQVYGAATEAAGQYYVQNAGDTHQALNQLGPLGAGTSAVLKAVEGEDLHNAVVQQGQMANIPGGPGAQNRFPGGVLAPIPVPGINAPPPPPARPNENRGQQFTRWVITAAPTVIAVVGIIIGASGGASEEPVEGDPNGGGGPGGDIGGGGGDFDDELGPGAPAAGRYGIDLENLRPTGTVAGEAATRPYINSPLTIKNIIESGTPAADKFVPGALRWEVPGSFNGSQGVYELVIDPATNRILHFLFRSGG